MTLMRNTFRALLATVALAATVAVAAPALAAAPLITLSNQSDPDTMLPGQHLIADFNEGPSFPGNVQSPYPTLDSNFLLTLGGATVGYQEGMGGYSGTLAGDNTPYLTIIPGTTVTLTALTGSLTSFSFYMGSPDNFNSIHLYGLNGYDELVTGPTLVSNDTNQQWSWGKRINLDFGGAQVTSIQFNSTNYSFELDNFAGATAAVPEASTWALMIVGFGAAGAALRRRRASGAVATA